jgi:hypothetical protein
MKLTNQQYKFICEILWGGVPVDRIWAEDSKLFIESAPKILEKYPYLDKSFFDDYKKYKISFEERSKLGEENLSKQSPVTLEEAKAQVEWLKSAASGRIKKSL